MDFRDVVHATQAQMLSNLVVRMYSKEELLKFILVRSWLTNHLHLLDWTAEMKAKASICISKMKP